MNTDALRAAVMAEAPHVVVIGDLILDRYVDGRSDRLSPEAPVPVVEVEDESTHLGGAANVAAGLAALGVSGHLVGVVGDDDDAGAQIAALADTLPGFEFAGIAVRGRPTTVKERVRVDGRHLMRIDRETTDPLDTADAAALRGAVREAISTADAVVVSDYAKGVVGADVMAELRIWASAHDGLLVVDPKAIDLSIYAGAAVLSPNHDEAMAATALPHGTPIDEVLGELARIVPGTSFLVTHGADGMAWRDRDGSRLDRSAIDTTVADVTGAGDSVTAAVALGLSIGLGIDDILDFASLLAAAAVSGRGTVAPGWAEIAGVERSSAG